MRSKPAKRRRQPFNVSQMIRQQSVAAWVKQRPTLGRILDWNSDNGDASLRPDLRPS